jgi:signal transduction histidine kinase
VVRIDGFAQDITGLRGAERRQRTAAVLGHLGLSGLPIDALLSQAADAIANELQLDHAVVTERVEEGWLVRALERGQEPLLDGEPIVFGSDSLTAFAQEAGEPVVVEDWWTEQRMRQPALARRYGIRSSVAVVIGTPEAPLGVLSGHARVPRTLDAEELAFAQTVAGIVALADQRMRLEEEVAEQSAARGRLLAQALDAEDRARRAISEALHDGPLQDLLVLGHDVSRLRGDPHHLERVREGIARAVRQIREVMLDLHPVVLQVGGLESALSAICTQQARAAGLECRVHIDPEAAGRRDDLVLSLARELLRNVAKHAGAGEVTVEVRDSPAGVRLVVTDDGRGIEPGRLREALGSGHIGVASCRERAEAIGGRLHAGARPDGRSGTQAVAVLPVG